MTDITEMLKFKIKEIKQEAIYQEKEISFKEVQEMFKGDDNSLVQQLCLAIILLNSKVIWDTEDKQSIESLLDLVQRSKKILGKIKMITENPINQMSDYGENFLKIKSIMAVEKTKPHGILPAIEKILSGEQ
jgi:hypothetical protein